MSYLWSVKKIAQHQDKKGSIEFGEEVDEHTPLRYSVAIEEEHRQKQAEEIRKNRMNLDPDPLTKLTHAKHEN